MRNERKTLWNYIVEVKLKSVSIMDGTKVCNPAVGFYLQKQVAENRKMLEAKIDKVSEISLNNINKERNWEILLSVKAAQKMQMSICQSVCHHFIVHQLGGANDPAKPRHMPKICFINAKCLIL